MLAVDYSTMSKNLKYYCDQVTDNCETVIVTGQEIKQDGSDSNFVLLSMEKYNSMLKIVNNAQYLAKIDLSLQQLDEGNVISKTFQELEALANG